MKFKAVLIVLWIASFAAISAGQGMRGDIGNPASNPSWLLQRDDVRTDLQLTDDEKSKLYDLQQGLRERFSEAARATRGDRDAQRKAFENIGKKISEDVNAILTPGQQTRLKEISIQLAGFASAAVEAVQKKLSLNDTQKAKIGDLVARQGKATTEAWERLQNGEIQFQDVRDAIQKNEKILNDMIGQVLTPGQKVKLKTLGGKKFVPAADDGV